MADTATANSSAVTSSTVEEATSAAKPCGEDHGVATVASRGTGH
ncbi:MAG: hypothetical protein ACRDRL_31955 [Sciscionella sp.]